MKKMFFLFMVFFAFILQTKAQKVNFRDSSLVLLVNDLPYTGSADSLYGMPGNGLFPSEKMGKEFLFFGNCPDCAKAWINIYTQEEKTGLWRSVYSAKEKTWKSFGPLKKMEKASDSQVFIYLEKKILHLKRVGKARKPFWVYVRNYPTTTPRLL